MPPTSQNLNINSPLSGAVFLPHLKDHVDGLWDTSTIRLTGVTGTAAAFTATCTPAPLDYVNGMAFWCDFPTAPASGATLKIGSLPTRELARSDGNPIVYGDVPAGSALLQYVGPSLRVMSIGLAPRAPMAGQYNAPQVINTRRSLIPGSEALNAEGPSSKFKGVGAGRWRLMAIRPNPGGGYKDSVTVTIVRVK